jgi:hypothetical protein
MSLFLGSVIKDNCTVFIRFTLDSNASADSIKYWDSFRYELFRYYNNETGPIATRWRGITQKRLLNRWRKLCLLDSNKQLPVLEDTEGGLGTNKQIRLILPNKESEEYDSGIKGEIRMLVVDGSDISSETWSLEEIKDLMNAFVKLCDFYNFCKCQPEIIIISD